MREANFIAIIPARGGSKRLPGKNIRLLGGKPLINWTIEAAGRVPKIEEVMVTTDDPEIAEVAKKAGAKVPFLRPKSLSTDQAGTVEVIRHTLDFYRNTWGREFDYLVLLQPTSPLREGGHIEKALALLEEKGADAVISVCPCEHSPLWANTLPEDKSLKGFLPEKWLGVRSQDLPQFYRLNGAIYICRVSAFEKEGSVFLKDKIFAYEMPIEDSVDIDTELDFELADIMVRKKYAHGN